MTQPVAPAQTCTVSNGSGNAATNVTNVIINCGTTGLMVGGSVSGLLGTGLVRQKTTALDNIPVSGERENVTFTFPTELTPGAGYAVTVLTQPSNPAQVCSVVNGTGTANSNVSNVQIACTQPGFKISGSVVGLVEGAGDVLELQNNAGDDLFVAGDTTFTFPTQVTNGGIYNVTVFSKPNSQPQPCTSFFYSGIAISDVSTVVIDCQHNDWAWQSWYLSSTTAANNYASVTTPLQPAERTFSPRISGLPAAEISQRRGPINRVEKVALCGNGFPYPNPLGQVGVGFLNDLWVFDENAGGAGGAGGWVPANLQIFTKSQSLPQVFQVRTDALEEESAPTGTAPGGRWGSSSWTSTTGDLYLFGGQGNDSNGDESLLNDLWKCTPAAATVDSFGAGTASCPWTLVGGSTVGNTSGSYGTQGAPGGVPGGRWAAATTTDGSGNVWLFGGQGLDSAGTTGLLNDLWEYNGTQWTWVGPSNSNIANQNGKYPSAPGPASGSGTNAPGGRQAAVLWADAAGNIWLFGGFGLDSAGTGNAGPPPAGAILNDLWEFNISTKQWIWISGSNLANQTGTYTTQATSNLSTGVAANVPGSRWGAAGFTDANSNLWLFSGWGYGTNTTDPTGFLDDTWEYQQSSGQWIWWKGITNVNQNTVFATQHIPFALSVLLL